MLTTSDLKAQLRVIDTGEPSIDEPITELLDQCLDGAKSYVDSAVGATRAFYEIPENEHIYKIAVLSLASAYYQNPSALATGTVVKVDLVLQAIVAQLRGRYATYMAKAGDGDG